MTAVSVFHGRLDRVPAQGVYWDHRTRQALVVVVLDADEARGLASGLPVGDTGATELEELAEVADGLWKEFEGD